MPRMDGPEFISRLMCLHPMPVVMIFTLTTRGSKDTMAAPGADAASGQLA
ncbi:hypothetical protein [Enterobacter mori]